MARMIELSLTGFGRTVEAILLDEEQPEYAEHLWQELKTPLPMWSWHPMMTGDWFACKARPLASKAPPVRPARSTPTQLMCEMPAGSIMYAGDRMLRFAYGPDITEPLPGVRPIVASAADPEMFFAAGKYVLKSQFGSHEPIVVTARRKGA